VRYLAALSVLFALFLLPAFTTAPTLQLRSLRLGPQNPAEISLTLIIEDKKAKSGLSTVIHKSFKTGTNALDAMKSTVVLKENSGFVTSICGVDAPAGHFWGLYVDGKFSKVGIGGIKLAANTTIHWVMTPIKDYGDKDKK